MNSYDQSRRILAIGITAVAGFVDATGFLAADRYFVSFMSGNTTRLAVDLVTDPAQALIPLGLIGGFVVGVTMGAVVSDQSGHRRKTAVLALATMLLGLALLSNQFGNTAALMGCMVLAMGVLNNSFRRNGEVAVGVTYMTGALVRIGQVIAARLQGRSLPGWKMTLALWLGLVGGAIAGAAAYLAAETAALGLAFIWVAGLTLWASRIETKPAIH
jgi:uncharacterized membrane protein YoaK (UPF0700 family)